MAWSSHRGALHQARVESYYELQSALTSFEAVYNAAPVGYQDIDTEGVILRVNPKECSLRGLRPDEMIGKNFWQLFPEPHQKRIHNEVKKKLTGDASLGPIQRNYLRPDGRLLTLEIHEILLRDHLGKVLGMRTASVDMTEPTKKQEQVWQATSELNAVFQAFPDLFLRLDSSGIVLGARSPSHSEIFGPQTDFTGRPLTEMFPIEVTNALLESVSAALRNGQLVSIEYSLERPEAWGEGRVKHFEARVIPLHWNEVVVIVREMTERKEAEQRLAVYADELKRKNAEVEAKNVELVHALATAREATKLKSQFLANMSHEIRTPMNGVLGMTEFLLGTELTGEQREYGENVKTSAESLLVIINDILDLSKIEAGKMTVESIPFDIMAVVKEVSSAFALRAKAKGLEFELDLHVKDSVTVRSDPGRLRQILTNLLGNALKFTETGTITLRTKAIKTESGKPQLQVQVEDTGIGIPDDQRERLFQSFVQVDGSMNRRYGGTGLGLAISKHLVTMLEGEIGFKSQYRRGSLFWFAIPCETAVEKVVTTIAPPSGLSLDGLGVLLVAEPGGDSWKLQIERLGCRCEEVSRMNSIIPALKLAAQSERPYRIVIVDTSIAGMGGLSLGRTIRSDEKIKSTLMIALSSDPTGDGPRLVAEGFIGVIQKVAGKPLSETKLKAVLSQALLGKIPLSAIATEAKAPTRAPIKIPRPSSVVEEAKDATNTSPAKATARILLAEDNLVNQKIALRLLEKAGLSADLAKNGKEAVEAVKKSSYDLILMDCQMPEMDGFEATQAIRHLEKAMSRHTPIVALTANAMTGDRERCLDSGMDDYVSKPFDVKALQGLIARWLDPAAKA